MMIIDPNWPAPRNVKAFTSTRIGGQSQPPYMSLNLGQHVGDQKETVMANRQLLSRQLGLPSEPIWLAQIHGTTVVRADQHIGKIVPTADASWTQATDVVCAVLTADCLPILLCNKAGTLVAAIHAGWRGLAAGIVEEMMTVLNEADSEVLAWLGPAIGPEIFEVSHDVRDIFIENDPVAKEAFKANNSNKWLANIYLLAKQRLEKCGVTAVYGGEHCTYIENDLFYSFRRDHGVTGRMATLIWLNA